MSGLKNSKRVGVAGLGLVLAVIAAQPAMAHNPSKSERWHRPNYVERGHVVRVDAPFTSVETRRWRTTAVDAPFTSVRVDRRRGVWVRAPFVNLYVPR